MEVKEPVEAASFFLVPFADHVFRAFSPMVNRRTAVKAAISWGGESLHDHLADGIYQIFYAE